MPDSDKPISLVGLLEAAKKATPGSWKSTTLFDSHQLIAEVRGYQVRSYCEGGLQAGIWDAEFIAACNPDTIRALVEAVRAAQASHLVQQQRDAQHGVLFACVLCAPLARFSFEGMEP